MRVSINRIIIKIKDLFYLSIKQKMQMNKKSKKYRVRKKNNRKSNYVKRIIMY